MKRTFLIVLNLSLILSTQLSNAQDNSILSKQQMLRDFDYLVDTIIAQVYSKEHVMESITGVDFGYQMKRMRQEVENIDEPEKFPYLIQQVLNLMGDEHSDIIRGNYINDYMAWANKDEKKGLLEFVDTSRTEEANQRYLHYRKERTRAFGDFKFYLYSTYLNGEYYNLVEVKTNKNNIKIGDKILKINDIDIHRWVNINLKDYNSYSWDNENKRFYASNIIYTPAITKNRDSIKIDFESQEGNYYSITFGLNKRPKFVDERKIQINLTNVKYFGKDRVLYVRLNNMFSSKEHVKKIRKYGRSKKIERIIVDIRDNGGGNDLVWKEIVAELLDLPITTDLKIVAKDQPIIKKYLNLKKSDTVNFEDDKYLKLDCRALEVSLPNSQGLAFNKKIILLINKNIFSSAGSFAAYGLYNEKFIVVGSYPDKPIGIGITPFYIMLPESAILVQVDPSIDITDCKSYRDLYRKSGIQVKESIQSRDIWLNKNGNRWKRSFLIKHDPFYQKALEVDIN